VPARRDAGRQGRMSGTPPPRRLPHRSHSSLTARPGPRRAGHGRWGVKDAPSARAASLASSAALPVPARCRRGRGPRPPTLDPTRNPTLDPTPATRVPPRRPGAPFWLVRPPRGASRPQKPRPTSPPRGSGAARPGGALRAIDSTACPRLSADLRSAPPAAAISAFLDCHAQWYGKTKGPQSARAGTDQWLARSCVLKFVAEPRCRQPPWQRLRTRPH
jgi:hypothetical protein